MSDNTADTPAIEPLLRTYPRVRPPLSAAHQASFVEHYRANRSQQGISGVVMHLEAWMHRELARHSAETILEIGAGTLNHVPYHPGARVYDVVEPFRELWEDSPHRDRVRTAVRNSFLLAYTDSLRVNQSDSRTQGICRPYGRRQPPFRQRGVMDTALRRTLERPSGALWQVQKRS